MMRNTGENNMSKLLKNSIIEKIGMDITPEAEDVFYDAVLEYIRRLSEESIEILGYSGRKTLRKEDVELALKFLMLNNIFIFYGL